MPERMPTSPPSPPAADDAAEALDASVSAMVGQLAQSEDDAAERELAEFEALMPAEAQGTGRNDPGASGGLTQTAGAPGPRLVVHQTDDDDLLRTVQELLGEALREDYTPTVLTSSRPVSVVPAAPEPAEAAARIETLDQELAGIADDLIETERADDPEELEEDPTLSKIPAQVPKAPAPETSTATEEPPNDDLDNPPAAALSEQAAPIVPAAIAAHVLHIRLPRLRAPGLSLLHKPLLCVCAAVSSPLKAKPQHIRDIVGWNALWLAFLGGCVWIYILFFRSPEPPVTSLLPENGSHVEPVSTKSSTKGGSHGSKPSTTEPKKPAAKKPGGH